MKLLFDNNLSITVAEHFASVIKSQHVYDLNIDRLSDRQIWQYALENDFSIISKDKDFYHLANSLGAPPKFIWLSIGNCKNEDLINLLHEKAAEIKNFLRSKKAILVINRSS